MSRTIGPKHLSHRLMLKNIPSGEHGNSGKDVIARLPLAPPPRIYYRFWIITSTRRRDGPDRERRRGADGEARRNPEAAGPVETGGTAAPANK